MNNALFEHMPLCFICAVPGTEFLYAKSAYSFTEDTYTIKKCPCCGLLWVDPRPSPHLIGAYYDDFEPRVQTVNKPSRKGIKTYTRNAILAARYGYDHLAHHRLYRHLGNLLALVPMLRFKATHELDILFPRYKTGSINRLLDIGCGSGNYLAIFKQLGWDVLGIELNLLTADLAKQRGFAVQTVPLEVARFPGCSFSHISLNHTLEHLFNPMATIKECMRILMPQGNLTMRFPNSQSLGFKHFSTHWLGLDPPRHLYVFSPISIRKLFATIPYHSLIVKTSPQSARYIFNISSSLPDFKPGQPIVYRQHKGSALFAVQEQLLCAMGNECGEEIEVLVIK